MDNDEFNEADYRESMYVDERFDALETKIRQLESRIEQLYRKVYDIPIGASVHFIDMNDLTGWSE
jgi:hypothetical protein